MSTRKPVTNNTLKMGPMKLQDFLYPECNLQVSHIQPLLPLVRPCPHKVFKKDPFPTFGVILNTDRHKKKHDPTVEVIIRSVMA